MAPLHIGVTEGGAWALLAFVAPASRSCIALVPTRRAPGCEGSPKSRVQLCLWLRQGIQLQ